ncbi:MAG: SDR family oxidoreductase [Candidatus Moraniibacteriota bacterium]
MEFKNKIVLITGASQGIGAETARLFAKEGAIVVVNYLSSDKLAEEVLKDVKKVSDGIAIKCDATNEKDVKEMIARIISTYSKIDILVNNVGKYLDGDEWNGDSNVWRESLNSNVISTLNVSKYVAKEFIKQRSGIIVNLSSRYARMGAFDTITYAASKAAILNITQAYSKLLSPFGRANAVSPGATDAGYWKRAPKQELEEVKSRSLHKQLITPRQIANTILFLSSDKSEMITGQEILVDGGK